MFEQNVYYSNMTLPMIQWNSESSWDAYVLISQTAACFISSGGTWLEVSQRFINTYIQSQLNFFDRDSWTRLKQDSSPSSCSGLSLITAWLQLIFYMFDLLAGTKPKMTAAVDKGLHLVKGRQHNHRTRDITSSN